ncbi:unnamed protein product, partial [marine sediment metagenome]
MTIVATKNNYAVTQVGHTVNSVAANFIESAAYLGNGIAIIGADDVYRSTDYGATWAGLGLTVNDYPYSLVYLG